MSRKTAGNSASAAAEIAVTDLSYEQARDELVEIVRTLEAGEASLEESLELWERGEVLATRCQEWLDGARTRLDAARGRSEPSDDSSSE